MDGTLEGYQLVNAILLFFPAFHYIFLPQLDQINSLPVFDQPQANGSHLSLLKDS
jgi:hypothetical protein